mgnify:FL=1
MGFNEMTHAFIAARYYVRMTEAFGERGHAAFIHAVEYYGSQRGRRMAQRAIRDGQPLTYETYCRYGEWVNTEEICSMGEENRVEISEFSPDYVMNIYQCPWHSQFKRMGLKEAGLAYCSVLDASICRGFEPDIRYEVPQTLHDHDHCIQIVRNAGLKPGEKIEKNPAGLKSFEYHCAHSYWSFREVAAAIFGSEGEAAADQVMADFEAEYGKEMAETLASYKNTNFNIA